MIVNDQAPKFVYVDPPKTGTRSVQALLRELFPSSRDVGDHRQTIDREWRRYQIFATVRDPYERALSCWARTIREDLLELGHAEGLQREYGDASPLSFSRWLVDGAVGRRARGGIWPLPSQIEFLAPIAKTVGGWKRIQIVKMENLSHDLTRLPFMCRRMSMQLSHLNASTDRPAVRDQPAEFVEYVNVWAGADFKQFGYQRIDPLARTRSGGMTPNDEVRT